MTTTINASTSNGLVQTADGSGIIKVQSNGVTTNALAWVNFDGTTSPGTIRSSYNISSVTKASTSNFTINFTNALSDTNYAIVGTSGNTTGNTSVQSVIIAANVINTTSCFYSTSNGGNTPGAYATNSIIVFGN